MEIRSLLRNSIVHSIPPGWRVYNLTGSSAALLLALEDEPFVAIEKDEADAGVLRKDINFYRKMFSRDGVIFLPDRNGPSVSGVRARTVYLAKPEESLVTSSHNLLSTFWERDSLGEKVVQVKVKRIMARSELEESLAGLGYIRTPMVAEAGDYSRREWIVDIFPSTSEDPIRIEFYGDEIDQIKTFDIATQRSVGDVDEFFLFPAGEPAEERNLSDIMPGKRFFCLYPDADKDGLPDDTVFLSRYSFGGLSETDEREVAEVDAGLLSLKGYGILPEERKGLDELPERIRDLAERNRVIIISSSQGQAERLRELFRDKDVIVPLVDVRDLGGFGGLISITVGELSAGIFVKGLMVLTERELFGERHAFRPIRRSKVAELLQSLDDITVGDYVVHRDHGVGRFTGIMRRRMEENELELMVIEYEDGRLSIPVQKIQDISKYRSEEGVVPRVDRLGGKTWQRKKERVRKKVHDLAARLLSLYAGRKVARGFSFSADTEMHREFDSFFPYEETPDQLKTVDDIKKDMEAESPMDRLVCGDVGYGKTEVAMRAAFKAVYDNRQVAVLVPTTILAEQHYRTFRERFSGFPVTIDFISRFKSRKEIAQSLKDIAHGTTDIVIGTHSLLSKKVVFNRLGLLIVDEEHRFGVGQKEKIKEMSRAVDVLNLTATPIPRTLHMALSGIRNISVIETPPEERLSVKSVVTVWNDSVIREAVSSEIRRSGQVFFVHNRIQDIYKIARRLQELVPGTEMAVAHGQMPERELESVMHRFFEGSISVLVSTAIIGAGLDIPRANTIIINMSDRMGLADLYQLRGRVGRSNVRGFAFFLAPPESAMTEIAKKRLQAVQEMSYLGAGFRLALKDLEIRGAGDIFGPEQSGHIHEIGFDLYIEMLESAVAELKGVEIREEPEPVIDLSVSAFIPDDYVDDMTLRLTLYRRIAAVRTEKDVEDLETEIKDRFGSPAEEVRNLLKIMRLKVLARELRVTEIRQSGGDIFFSFSFETGIQPQDVFDLQKKRKGRVKFLPDGFTLSMKGASWEDVHAGICEVMTDLREKIDRLLPVEDTVVSKTA